MHWSKWIRQTHRWLSVVFTLAVIANGVTILQEGPRLSQLAAHSRREIEFGGMMGRL